MLTTFNTWLGDNVQSKGILGAGVRYNDKSVHTVILDSTLKQENLEYACTPAAEVFQTFKLRRSPVQRLDWNFEKGILHTAVRSDGNCLCLISQVNGVPQEELDRIFYEFQTLW